MPYRNRYNTLWAHIMPSRQMDMSTGAKHARDQCVHQLCVEGPDSFPGLLRGQSVQIISTFMRLNHGTTTPFWLYVNNENAEVYSKAILSKLLAFWSHDKNRNRTVISFDTSLEHLISLRQNVSAALLNLLRKANAWPSISLYILKNKVFVILWVLFTFYTTVGSINLLHKVNEDEKLPSLIFTK